MRQELLNNNNPELKVIATNFFTIRFFKRSKDFFLQKLTSRQLAIYQTFLEHRQLSKKEVVGLHQVSEDTAMRELKVLISEGMIEKKGEGKATVYVLVLN